MIYRCDYYIGRSASSKREGERLEDLKLKEYEIATLITTNALAGRDFLKSLFKYLNLSLEGVNLG